MVLDGRSIIERKIVTLDEVHLTYEEREKQVQPNGLDLRVSRIFKVTGEVTIPREGKAKASLGVEALQPKEGIFTLTPGGIYWADFLETASLKDGYCARLITRSSLVRAGIDVAAGLWDTGWEGQLGCSFRVWNTVHLEWGARVCQILVEEAEFNGHRYDGRYQGQDSQTSLIK